jgi:hypothetical protein
MQYHYTILVLTAAVSAIDIRGHIESHCGGGNVVSFFNVVADRCYATSGISWAYSFVAIPRDWTLETRSHRGGNCNEIVHRFNSNGQETVCHGAAVNNLDYTGAGFSFLNRKRSENAAFDGQACEKPDPLTLEGGPSYTLSGLEDATLKTMVKSSPKA